MSSFSSRFIPATEKSILRSAFKKGDAWFNTGDALKQIGCGHLKFVDRLGDTYRWKGENVSTTEVENIIDGSGLVEEAIVYGIEIPNTNGKAGMVKLAPQQDLASFEPDKLFRYLSAKLPSYAISVFVRVTERIEKTGTFKYKKVDFKKVAYTVGRSDDEVYAWLPKTGGYTRIDGAVAQQIDAGEIRF